MKLLTKETDYAVRALLVLAKNKSSFVSARDIAKVQSIPYQFLRRVLGELIKHKIIESREGFGGGFRLIKAEDEVKVDGLIKIFQGNIQISECIFRKRLCHNRKSCALRHEIKKVEKIVSREFEGISIGKLLKNKNKGRR